jgi:hypothetical protein
MPLALAGSLALFAPLALDWPTWASLATAAGTLVLAIATFASVRSANRSARVAEQALQERRRPVLSASRLEDPLQKIRFVDDHWVRVAGAGAVAEHTDGNTYLAISLRNLGAGLGVLQAWIVTSGINTSREHADLPQFRTQTRDLYIAPGDVGLWQAALRDPADDAYAQVAAAATQREALSVELLYSDQVGEQRTISRFLITPAGEDRWIASVGRHWFLDRDGPR